MSNLVIVLLTIGLVKAYSLANPAVEMSATSIPFIVAGLCAFVFDVIWFFQKDER